MEVVTPPLLEVLWIVIDKLAKIVPVQVSRFAFPSLLGLQITLTISTPLPM